MMPDTETSFRDATLLGRPNSVVRPVECAASEYDASCEILF